MASTVTSPQTHTTYRDPTCGSVTYPSTAHRFRDVYAALAAYNGGPENAARWLAAAAGSGADFVSACDFAATQDYVRRIMAHYAD